MRFRLLWKSNLAHMRRVFLLHSTSCLFLSLSLSFSRVLDKLFDDPANSNDDTCRNLSRGLPCKRSLEKSSPTFFILPPSVFTYYLIHLRDADVSSSRACDAAALELFREEKYSSIVESRHSFIADRKKKERRA